MTDPLAQARQLFLEGLAHFEAGRLEQAALSFEASLSLAPGRPSVLFNLALTRMRLGRLPDALPLFEEAVAAEPGNPDTWMHLGTVRAELGDPAGALAAFDSGLALDGEQAGLWSRRGSVQRELGRLEEAAASFERAIALGADPQLHAYYLAAVRPAANAGPGTAAVPQAAPRVYVESLFDSYAGNLQEHLVDALRYQAPQVLPQGLQKFQPAGARHAAVLDLGCGTGLVGRLLQPQADHIDGVDLSGAMVAQARDSGAYADVAHADVVAYLQDATRTYDLVLAADVFIYVGALDAVFAGVRRVLAPGGLFAFSVEPAASGHELQLLPSLRYAHSESYVRWQAVSHGMDVLAVDRAPLREDQGRPVPGLYVYLRRR